MACRLIHAIEVLCGEDSSSKEILAKLEKIMASQAELAVQIAAVTEKVAKIGTETRSLLTKIDELKAVIAAGAEVSPALQASVDALSAQASVVDGLVEDAA